MEKVATLFLFRCPDGAGGSFRCSSCQPPCLLFLNVLSRGQDKSMPACSQDASTSVRYGGVAVSIDEFCLVL